MVLHLAYSVSYLVYSVNMHALCKHTAELHEYLCSFSGFCICVNGSSVSTRTGSRAANEYYCKNVSYWEKVSCDNGRHRFIIYRCRVIRWGCVYNGFHSSNHRHIWINLTPYMNSRCLCQCEANPRQTFENPKQKPKKHQQNWRKTWVKTVKKWLQHVFHEGSGPNNNQCKETLGMVKKTTQVTWPERWLVRVGKPVCALALILLLPLPQASAQT